MVQIVGVRVPLAAPCLIMSILVNLYKVCTLLRMKNMRTILIILLLTVSAITGSFAQTTPHELLAKSGTGGWLNTVRPLTAADLKDHPVLLDFWTYGCINCMQIVPDLDALEQKFGDQLLIIGVHSAKFKGEQGSDRILAAAKRFGLKHPVINDSDFKIWNSYKVNAWPTLILLDSAGQEITRYAGEGHRADLENDIAAALKKTPATKTVKAMDIIAADMNMDLLSFPARLAYAPNTPSGALFFVTDTGHDRIIGFTETGAVKTIIGSGTAGRADGSFTAAQFNHPRGLTYFKDALYVADTGNHELRRVDLAKQTVETVAGTGQQGNLRRGENLKAATTSLTSPWDVEDMGDGHTLAIAMAGTHQLWAYDTGDKILSVLAGSGAEDIKDGTANDAALAQPSGLSQSGGSLFFVDAESSALRELTGGKVKTLIGTGLFDFGQVDGAYPAARLQHAQGLYAEAGRIIIADTYNNALRIYNRETKMLSTILLRGANLSEPGDVFIKNDIAWIADTNHHVIKKADLKTGQVTEVKLVR